ncbi:DUF7691 family protein [Aeoliella sp.]|uniref:DUF7691 family protein n=1 Tax=Aeoliella sp. TaxID=2795800 RepID=UPI003CCBD4BD
MSYVLTAYLVDIDKLQAIVGSKDASLVEAIKANNAEFFDDEEEEFDDDELWLSTAIEHLVMDQEKDTDEAHQYGYALIEICGYCGELQPCDLWDAARWAAVEACGLEHLLTKTKPPVELPPNNDFPSIGCLRRAEVAAELTTAKDRLAATKDEDVSELLEEYVGWLQTADEKGQDMVFFYH